MSVLGILKYCALLLGLSVADDKFKPRVYLFLSIQVILLVNILYFISERWQNVDDRFNGLKAVIFMSNYASYAVSFVFYWADFSPIIRMFYQINFRFPYEISSRRADIIESLQVNMKRFDRYWRTIITAYVISFDALPALILLVKVCILSEDTRQLIKETQSSPMPLYFPQFIERFQRADLEMCVYVAAYVLQSVYSTFVSLYAQFGNVTCLCAIANVQYELKLLRLSFLEMKHILRDDASSEPQLRIFTRYFVQHHQNVCRRFQVVNKGIRWVAASLSTTASLYMCMSIYTIVQKDQMVLKGQEVVLFVLWAYAIYLLDSCGQRVETEDEKLRNAMYECDWLEKPEWFKRSLLMAMTRASKPIVVKPFAIFSLNLNGFALTMNAAYSYYNLLHNIKNK